MIVMGVKFKAKTNKFPSMIASVKALDGKKISVGVLRGEHKWLASIHEYGCRIPVTDKMRNWLKANGLPLKSSTTEIVIPERSFLRAGFDKYHEQVLDKANLLEPLFIDGTISEEEFFDTIGNLLADRIKDYAEDLNSPAKHPFTLQQNGNKANPLVDSGNMINEGITYEVE